MYANTLQKLAAITERLEEVSGELAQERPLSDDESAWLNEAKSEALDIGDTVQRLTSAIENAQRLHGEVTQPKRRWFHFHQQQIAGAR